MPVEPSATRRRLGRLLAAQRRATRTNARDMGVAIGRSHTHVSRIERGEGQISLDEARRWLDAVDASDDVRRDTLALVEAVATESASRRLDGLTATGSRATDTFKTARVVDGFAWEGVPALLQTPAYCRRVGARLGVGDLEEYVGARVRLQALLESPTRSFRFVIRSEVLAAVDRAQRAHIEQVDHDLGHVSVRVADLVQLPARVSCSFDLHSDDVGPTRVGIELPHGVLELTRDEDLAVYRELFDELFDLARPL